MDAAHGEQVIGLEMFYAIPISCREGPSRIIAESGAIMCKGMEMLNFVSGSKSGKFALAALLIGTGALVATDAMARPGKGFSFGSRGSRTYSAPPPTATAPGAAAPMQKSITPNQPSAAAQATRPAAGMAQPAPARSSMFRNLLLGGLIGAGLASIFGVGAFASVMGFLLQTLLIGGLIYLAVQFFRNRSQTARAGGPNMRSAASGPNPDRLARATIAGNGGPAGGAGPMAGQMNGQASGMAAAGAPLQLAPADFDSFERLLGEVQGAYGREDMKSLETRLTPEMLSYFAEELETNKRNGVVNRVTGIKLLQGDLSEAWSERGQDYATVAMRYAITDQVLDRASGRVVEGRSSPDEVTEVWTFTRRGGSGPTGWELSAIQQT